MTLNTYVCLWDKKFQIRAVPWSLVTQSVFSECGLRLCIIGLPWGLVRMQSARPFSSSTHFDKIHTFMCEKPRLELISLASSFYKCWKRKQGMNKLMELTRRLNSHGRSLETLSPDSWACDLSTTLCCYVIKISYCGFFLSLRGSRLSSLCLKDVSKMWDGRWSF